MLNQKGFQCSVTACNQGSLSVQQSCLDSLGKYTDGFAQKLVGFRFLFLKAINKHDYRLEKQFELRWARRFLGQPFQMSVPSTTIITF